MTTITPIIQFPPASGSPGSFAIYDPNYPQQPILSGYSSSSDIETTASNSITDYSDQDGGYSSTASTSYDFVTASYQSTQPTGVIPTFPHGHVDGASQSPPPVSPGHFYPPAQQQQMASLNNQPIRRSSNSSVTRIHGGSKNSTRIQSVGGGQPQQYQRIARFVGPPPVALACTECRSRHLKCDAGTPSCTRCLTDRRDCSYVKSRRGWKGTRRKKPQPTATASSVVSTAPTLPGTEKEGTDERRNSSAPSATPAPLILSDTSTGGTGSVPTTPSVPTDGASPSTEASSNPLEILRTHYKYSLTFPSQQEPPDESRPSGNLMQLYYTYFHSAHPFCLPPSHLIMTPPEQITVLLSAMRFIASIYAKGANIEHFFRESEIALFGNIPPPKHVFTVQALLLFAIGLHSQGEQSRAIQVKGIAVKLAIELGMNQAEFSVEGTGGEGARARVLEESWRRTWWELYFVDGIMAGVQQTDNFQLWSVECTVPLPCEEVDYASGIIPKPHSLQEFDDRYFAVDNIVYSSFAYRVEAVRILGQVLSANATSPDETRADAADASLANWGLHLPSVKKELITTKDPHGDEMMFQAHMVINAATIYLNRPKSHLAIPLVSDETSCTPPTFWSPPIKPMPLHTARCIMAASTVSKLLTLPIPLIKHSPFIVSVITVSSVIHLAACAWLLTGDEGFLAKERIRLSVGALKQLEERWRIAGDVLGQVKSISREVFKIRASDMVTSDSYNAAIHEEDVLRFIEHEKYESYPITSYGGTVIEGWNELEWDGT